MIWFNVEEAYRFLIKFDRVYSLRPFLKREGKHILLSSLDSNPSERKKNRIKGIVIVSYIQVINPLNLKDLKELEQYVPMSGFGSMKEWLNHIKKPMPQRLFLHYVEIDSLFKKG